jgi:hypothetical protein
MDYFGNKGMAMAGAPVVSKRMSLQAFACLVSLPGKGDGVEQCLGREPVSGENRHVGAKSGFSRRCGQAGDLPRTRTMQGLPEEF